MFKIKLLKSPEPKQMSRGHGDHDKRHSKGSQHSQEDMTS